MDPAEVTPHVLRHTAASHLLASDMPIWRVARLLGQSVQRTTERYGHLDPEWLRDQVEVLDRLLG